MCLKAPDVPDVPDVSEVLDANQREPDVFILEETCDFCEINHKLI